MPKTIIQKILFRNTTPKALYDIYINAKKHTAATGAMAKINSKEGSNFTAHGGYISGRNLQIVTFAKSILAHDGVEVSDHVSR